MQKQQHCQEGAMDKAISIAFSSLTGVTLIVVVTIVLVLWNLEKVQRVAGWVCHLFRWVHRWFEYGCVANSIQASVNSAGKRLNTEAEGALPHPLRIRWAKSASDVEAFLQNGEVVVALEYSTNNDRNLVLATLTYLGKALLPRARPYVDTTLMKATDFTVAKQVLVPTAHTSAMSHFFDSYLEPELEREPSLQNACTRLDRLTKAGLFSRILLRELQHLGEKLYPATPDNDTRDETAAFSEFLETVATRQRGIKLPRLTFARARLRVEILLVAAAETKIWGTEPYARRIQTELARGVERLYILARGAENVTLALRIACEQQEAGRIRVLNKQRFTHTLDEDIIEVICISCSMNLFAIPKAQIDSSSELYYVLERNVEALQEGEIEVVSMARLPGVGSKVLVRSMQDNINALSLCTEPSVLEAMQRSLGEEELQFVEWNYDPKIVIVESLAPLDSTHVTSVEINAEKRCAVVNVDWWKEKRKALGKGDQNLTLAQHLIGWSISVVEEKEDKLEE